MCKITVVIPTYRRAQLLQKCLSALDRQIFPPELFEVIIVSDGPDPVTEAVTDCFDRSRFHYLPTETKLGPAAARNHGWRNAKGILIAFTDDDTLPDPLWLISFWNKYIGEKEIAYTGRTIVPLSASPTDYEKNTAGLETAEFITANCCCTKAALQAVDGFDERFSMAWREDSDLYFKFIKKNIPVKAAPEAIVLHPVRPAYWGISLKEQRKTKFNALLYKKYPELYREKIQARPLWNYYAMVFLLPVSFIIMVGGRWYTGLLFLIVWLILFIAFAIRRLKNTSKSFSHVSEMLWTSACIPFVSLFWHWYGNIKYKTAFL